ncbi:MAG: hypothetical protein COY40_05810 [Alphaproteobacteria bacterium CG_4_10_14_0_8_um_filter_53_9]|nr:MAG: hypothetical protein COY40_05810 [Alphaproteobacteria bacterium CG_4_10_14_0_8_um_filter_53_9]
MNMMKKLPFKIPKLKLTWEWAFLAIVLTILTLYLVGIDLGFNHHLTTVLGLLGLVMAPLLTFILFPLINLLLATLIMPLIGLVLTAAAALTAAAVAVLTPVLAAATAAWSTLLASTLGQVLIAPIYNLLGPIVLKIAPWLTTTSYVKRGWKILKRYTSGATGKPAARKKSQSK